MERAWPAEWSSQGAGLVKRNMVVADDAAFREKSKLLTSMERQKWLNSYMQKLLVVNSSWWLALYSLLRHVTTLNHALFKSLLEGHTTSLGDCYSPEDRMDIKPNCCILWACLMSKHVFHFLVVFHYFIPTQLKPATSLILWIISVFNSEIKMQTMFLATACVFVHAHTHCFIYMLFPYCIYAGYCTALYC